MDQENTNWEHSYDKQRIFLPALKVGAFTGATGFITGGLVATLRSKPTVGSFAFGSGLNCFFLGSTYWVYRSWMLKAAPVWYPSLCTKTPRDRILISGAAGALTGATAGLIRRGYANVIPGFIMWGMFGAGSQYFYALADEHHTLSVLDEPIRAGAPEQGFWSRVFRSEWSPIKMLTPEEHKHILQEKLLAVEAEISLVDEEIASLTKPPSDTPIPSVSPKT